MERKHFYKSIEELLREWPIFNYTKEELEKIAQLSKERNEELTIRIWGREYATFHPDGGIDPFEHEEIEEDGTLKMPPENDKGIIYEFRLVEEEGILQIQKKVKMKIKL